MRLLILAAAASLLPAASEAEPPLEPKAVRVIDPTANAPSDCPPISRYHAMKRGGPLMAEKLNQLPDADHYKAAYRTIGGCEAPIVASFGVRRR